MMLVPVKEYTSAADLRADIERRHNRKPQPSYGMRPETPKPPAPPEPPPAPSAPPAPPPKACAPRFAAVHCAPVASLSGVMRVEKRSPQVTVALIIREVAHFYGRQPGDLISSRRLPCLAFPRHVAMYLCRAMTNRSGPEIARRLGKKDHTTILHGAAKIRRMAIDRPELAAELVEIMENIEAAA